MFGLIYRYVSAVVSSIVARWQPEFVLETATCNGNDITNDVILFLAGSLTESEYLTNELVIITYRYKGMGPFSMYFDRGTAITFPPPLTEAIVPLEDTIVVAEIDGEDFTEQLQSFSGPFGDFYGMDISDFNIEAIFPNRTYEEITIIYGDGNEKTITQQTN